jgi:Holliday junction resolvase RusA-like endonuclease
VKNYVYIEGKFPSMNDIIAASKRHYACYSKMKKDNGEIFQWGTKKLPKFNGPVVITFTWFYKNKRRDPDNIMAAQKFALDAIVKNGIIQDDTGEFIASIVHLFVLGEKDGVGIEIELF